MGLTLLLIFSTSSPPTGEGDRKQGLWPILHTLSPLFLPPHSLPLLQHGVSRTGDSSPRTAPMWVLPTVFSSSRTSSAWVPSMGFSPLETDCFSVGPPRGHKFWQKTCSSLFTGPKVLPGTCSHRVTVSSMLIHLLRCRVLHRQQVDIYSWTAWLTMIVSMGCRGIFAVVPGAPHPSPSSLTLMSAKLFHIRLLHSLAVLLFRRFFFFFLNMLSQRYYHCCWWAWSWPVAGLSRSQMALALSDITEASSSHSCSCSCCRNLAYKPNTRS